MHPPQFKPILGPENGPQTGTAKESMPRVAGWSGQVFFGVRVFVAWGLGVSGFPGFRFLVLGDRGFRVFGVRAFGDRFGVRRLGLGCSCFWLTALFAPVLGASSFWFSGFRCLGFGFRVFDARVSGFGVFGFSDFDFWCSDFRILVFKFSVLWLSGFRFVGFQVWGFLVGAAQAAAASGRHRQPPQAAATGSR